jgi:hypothetical protein
MKQFTNYKPVTLIPFEAYLHDADCPELVDAFNGPIDNDLDFDDLEELIGIQARD